LHYRSNSCFDVSIYPSSSASSELIRFFLRLRVSGKFDDSYSLFANIFDKFIISLCFLRMSCINENKPFMILVAISIGTPLYFRLQFTRSIVEVGKIYRCF